MASPKAVSDEPYRRVRSREEWLTLLKENHDNPTALPFLRYALREVHEFPDLGHPAPAIAPREVREQRKEPKRHHAEFADCRERVSGLLDPDQGHRNSVSRLASLKPPAGYNPCPTPDQLKASFEANRYFIGPEEIFTISQAIRSGKPILADGPPGVGKSELAIQIATAMGLDVKNTDHFHPLFCTPDISKEESVYSWNDGKRLLDIQLVREVASRLDFDDLLGVFADVRDSAYSERYLEVQSLLRPCVAPFRTVGLVDEIDKAYPEFDALVLDIMAKNKFEVPGFGTVGRDDFDPKTSPVFVLTTNRERELSRALVRRMVPVWCDYLPEKTETKVVEVKAGLDEMTAGLVASFFYKIREAGLRLHQPPSTAEVIETAQALVADGEEVTVATLFRYHCYWCKFRRDIDAVREKFYDKKSRKWANSF